MTTVTWEKKRNMRGLHLPNVRAHRKKLKLNYRARGRPRLPKYMLEDMTDASVHDESSSEGIGTNSPSVLKVITSKEIWGQTF